MPTRSHPSKLIGQTFGRLTIESIVFHGGRNKCLCKCTCGGTVAVASFQLKSGNTSSCGCLRREMVAAKNTKHGLAGTPEHRIWKAMKQRCSDHPCDERYRSRGIKVCDRWINSFPNFFADMGPKPSPKHSIDRINNDGDYEPENCRWTTSTIQANNKTSNFFICHKGQTKTCMDWSRECGCSYSRLLRWAHQGKDLSPLLG